MDDTLITGNTWLKFNTFLGVSEDDDYRLYKAFINKEITYTQWLEELTNLYNVSDTQIPKEAVTALLTDITLAPGAQEAVAFCLKNGLIPVLITGSFDTTAKAVAAQLGIQNYVANTQCEYDDTANLKGIVSQGDEGESKVRQLRSLCRSLGISPETHCIAVGDSSNDIPLFVETGCGITFTWAKQPVQSASSAQIDSLIDLPHTLQPLL